jgi:hypothetical protein
VSFVAIAPALGAAMLAGFGANAAFGDAGAFVIFFPAAGGKGASFFAAAFFFSSCGIGYSFT